MTLRKAHGAAADHGALVVVETSPADELPAGLPAAPSGPVERRPDGTLTPAGARALGRQGGAEAARRRRLAAELADTLGLGADIGEELERYVAHATEFAAAQIAQLAATVGGGFVGPGPSSIVQSSALALAASRYLYAQGTRTGDPKTFGFASRLADKSRMGLLTAHELCAREAQARGAGDGDLEALLAAAAQPREGGGA